jgi:hypothetical protein
MVGLICMVLLIPFSAPAQEKQPAQYKLFKIDDYTKITNPNPLDRYRLDALTN